MNMNNSSRLDDKLNALLITAVAAIVVAVNVDFAREEVWARAGTPATAVARHQLPAAPAVVVAAR